MTRWAFESVSFIALDTRLNILNDLDPSSDVSKLVQSVREFLENMYELEIKPSIWKLYATPTFKAQMRAIGTTTGYVKIY